MYSYSMIIIQISNSNLLKQRRARRVSYKLLKHTIGIKPTSITLYTVHKIKRRKNIKTIYAGHAIRHQHSGLLLCNAVLYGVAA